MNILIYGYYGLNNLGDDLFEYIFKKLFSPYDHNYNITIQNPNNLVIKDDIDIVICGGGDIITDYFMIPLLKAKRKWEIKNKIHSFEYNRFN